MAKKRKPRRKRRTSLWQGPEVDGITNSLLTRWIVCRERFRLYAVEGYREDEDFSPALEFGQLWHEAEEAQGRGKDWRRAMRGYRDRLRAQHGSSAEDEIRKWYSVASTTFPIYVHHWMEHSDEVNRSPIMEEAAFRVPYELPSGRIITLRGKFDAVFRTGKSIWLQENKTKSKIDVEGITKTVDRNLQTMIYQIALRLFREGHGTLDGMSDRAVEKIRQQLTRGQIKGVLYNVIRRGLADLRAIKQRKGRMVKGKRVGGETEKQFYARLGEQMKSEPAEWFHRWKITLTASDVVEFRRRSLDPILMTLSRWWDSIEADPFNPWECEGECNPYHFQTPWGVYNSLASGFRGDFFEFLTDGKTAKLKSVDTLYPELEVK